MTRRVLEQMRSPLQRDASVLTLECGHLWSWGGEPAPTVIDCIHCDGGYPPLISKRLRDAQERYLELLGRVPVLPDDMPRLRRL